MGNNSTKRAIVVRGGNPPLWERKNAKKIVLGGGGSRRERSAGGVDPLTRRREEGGSPALPSISAGWMFLSCFLRPGNPLPSSRRSSMKRKLEKDFSAGDAVGRHSNRL